MVVGAFCLDILLRPTWYIIINQLLRRLISRTLGLCIRKKAFDVYFIHLFILFIYYMLLSVAGFCFKYQANFLTHDYSFVFIKLILKLYFNMTVQKIISYFFII